MTSVSAVKEQVQRYLSELVGVFEVDQAGNYTFRQGSTRLFIEIQPFADQHVIVMLTAPTNFELEPSPELFRFIATNGFLFGTLGAEEAEGKVVITLSHTLLGDFLDPEELKLAAEVLALTADEIDGEIQEKFGGELFYND